MITETASATDVAVTARDRKTLERLLESTSLKKL